MIGNILIVLSLIVPMVTSVFAQDYRALRSEDDLLYNIRYAYIEVHQSAQKRFECQHLEKIGQDTTECWAFRVDYKLIVATSMLMVASGFYLRRRSRSRSRF